MLVAMSAEFFQLNPGSGVTTIFSRGVTGHARRSLGRIGATLGAFQRDDDPDAFSHKSTKFGGFNKIDTNYYFSTWKWSSATY
jgi:hypothetical protein